MRALMTILLALSIGACDDGGSTDPEPVSASLTGRWAGSTVGVAADATLTETAAGAVTGSGTLVLPQGTIPITVSGTNRHPDVTLDIHSQGQPDGRFAGAFTDPNTVAGTLTVTGFSPVSLTLRRQ
jgi:hypothetical protein